jgi:hypothetical protein
LHDVVEAAEVAGLVPDGQFSVLSKTSTARQFAENPAPKGASEFGELTASLKRCPDTKRELFSKLFGVGRSGFTEN